MEVIKISPRYCYGVVDAINLAKVVAKDPCTRGPSTSWA